MSIRLHAAGRAYLVSIAVWGGLSLLTALQYRRLDQSLNIHTSFSDMILLAEARGFSFALLTPPIFYLVRRSLAKAQHFFWHIFVCCLGAIPFVVLWGCIRWLVLPPWDPALQRYAPRSGHNPLTFVSGGFADLITIYIAIVVAAHAYEYFERSRKQELERCEYRQALAASELQVLKMQLHPHFLFNTLHGISTLIESHAESAKDMLIKLSNLLRMTLQQSDSDLVPLRQELNFIHDYLDIEKLRLGERFTVQWSIAPESSSKLVPQLILQPLVENAIRHGIASSRGNGWIQISTRVDHGLLQVLICNSIGGKKTSGNGVGLRNTELRLKHLYSGDATFSFSIANQTATAILVLPGLGINGFGLQEVAASDLPNMEESRKVLFEQQ